MYILLLIPILAAGLVIAGFVYQLTGARRDRHRYVRRPIE